MNNSLIQNRTAKEQQEKNSVVEPQPVKFPSVPAQVPEVKKVANTSALVSSMQSIRTGDLLVRLDDPQLQNSQISTNLQNDLSAWAKKNGITLELDTNGSIGQSATKQFQTWYRTQYPDCAWASRTDGVIGLRTMRQLDLVLGRQEQLVASNQWISDDAFNDLLKRTQVQYYFQSEEGIDELISKLEQNEDKRKEIKAKLGNLNPDTLYSALSFAETGGELDKFIRTKAGGGISSAYGPVQITKSLVESALSRNILSPELRGYAKEYILQGNKFLDASISDPEYGLGGKGHLGERKAEYESMAKELIAWEASKSGSDLNNFIQRWRGVSASEDPRYFAKVQSQVLNSVLMASSSSAVKKSDDSV